jgi:uncharacterized protein (TIGR02646 family)
MIRVFKAPEVPKSLQKSNCTKYDKQDVQKALVNDQHGKCYLCEQKPGKDFQVDHLKPKADGFFPNLEFDWNNLFLACPYCNGRKYKNFEILNPTINNIEEIIEQRLDFSSNEVIFQSSDNNFQTTQTIELLNKLFNGESLPRKVKCEQLFNDIESKITFFFELLDAYKTNRTNQNKQALIDSLKITKEFLGFKYWIMKDYGFFDEFSEFMVWNKNY